MNDKFYTTKLTVEMEVQTQFGPADAIELVKNLNKVPAVVSFNVSKLETDYRPFFAEETNAEAMNNIPVKLW